MMPVFRRGTLPLLIQDAHAHEPPSKMVPALVIPEVAYKPIGLFPASLPSDSVAPLPIVREWICGMTLPKAVTV